MARDRQETQKPPETTVGAKRRAMRSERRDRLAEELRANLKKRKRQRAARGEGEGASKGESD